MGLRAIGNRPQGQRSSRLRDIPVGCSFTVIAAALSSLHRINLPLQLTQLRADTLQGTTNTPFRHPLLRLQGRLRSAFFLCPGLDYRSSVVVRPVQRQSPHGEMSPLTPAAGLAATHNKPGGLPRITLKSASGHTWAGRAFFHSWPPHTRAATAWSLLEETLRE